MIAAITMMALISGSTAFVATVPHSWQHCSSSSSSSSCAPRTPFIIWANNNKKDGADDGDDKTQHYDSSNRDSSPSAELHRVPPELEGIPIPFVDTTASSSSSSGSVLQFIECYVDSLCTVQGVEYTIGVPCDYSVALCYQDEEDQLIPIELADSATMDDLFPVAEAIVADEFGEELVLQRTPQTLTLVGELEEEDEDSDDDEDEEDNEDEEVEVLLSFEHRGKEYLLVRLLDPILLVGKMPDKVEGEVAMDSRVLLTPEESDQVMPVLEELFLQYHDDEYDEGDITIE